MRTDNHTTSSGHLSQEDLLNYHRHLLSGDNKERVEKHLRSCGFCTDALKGVSEMPDALRLYKITHDLKKRISKSHSSRKKIFTPTDFITYIAIALVIGIILLTAYYFLFLRIDAIHK